MITPTVPCVPYAHIRARICHGDLLLCQGDSLFATLIRHATHSPWSHVAFLMRLETIDRIMVLESVESVGIRTVPLSQYLTNYSGTHLPYPGRLYVARHRGIAALTREQLTQLAHQALDLCGTQYDKQEILGIAMRLMGDTLGLDAHPPTQNARLICSEFVQLCYASVGIALPGDPRGFVAPNDFVASPDVSLLWELAR